MKTLIPILLFGTASISGCNDADEDLHEISLAGLHQSDILQMLGGPDRVEELTKNNEHIFGPLESIWYKIEMGDKIVIWIYETRQGRKELYFLNDSTEVAGQFFWYKDHTRNPVF